MSVERRARILTAAKWSAAVSIAFFLAAPAAAQSSLQVPIQFDLLSPGARSLAVGSAFAGLADDATAATTNPAGLSQLTSPEVSVEGRFRSIDSVFLLGGRLSGAPTGTGVDTVNGPVFRGVTDSGAALSFASIVIPMGRFVFAGYRHGIVQVDTDFSTQGAIQALTVRGISFDVRDLPLRAHRGLTLDNYGASLSWRASTRVALGGGLSFYRFDMDSLYRRLATDGPFGPAIETTERARATQHGTDVKVGGSVAALVNVGGPWKVGAIYTFAPTVTFDFADNTIGPEPAETNFGLPDRLALGLSGRFERAMVTVEVTRIAYSALNEFVQAPAAILGRDDQFSVEDVTELHAGFEYTLSLPRISPDLRIGYWFEPDHSVKFRPALNDQFDELFDVTLSQGRDLSHITGGVGLAISRRFELNFGVDVSKRTTLATVSSVVRF